MKSQIQPFVTCLTVYINACVFFESSLLRQTNDSHDFKRKQNVGRAVKSLPPSDACSGVSKEEVIKIQCLKCKSTNHGVDQVPQGKI